MTGSEFLTYVKRIFVRTDKDTELYECMTDIVVDMRLTLLSDDYSTISSDLASGLSAGDYTIDVPSDFGHLLVDGVLIRGTGSDEVYNPLNKISKALYDHKYQEVYHSTVNNRNTSTPCEYAYYGRKLYLGPAVDHGNYEFKINYTTDGVADIVAGTTAVPFTDKYRKILRDGVLMLAYKMMENFEESARFEADYERGKEKIRDNDKFNKMESSPMAYNGV